MSTTPLHTDPQRSARIGGGKPGRPLAADDQVLGLGGELSGARLLRITDVCYAVGLSASQVYALVAEGAFPAPLRLSSRCSRWRARDIHAWLEALS